MHQSQVYHAKLIVFAQEHDDFVSPPYAFFKVSLGFFQVLGQLASLRLIEMQIFLLVFDILPGQNLSRVIVNCPGRIGDAPYNALLNVREESPQSLVIVSTNCMSLILILHRHFRSKDCQSENRAIGYLATLLGKVDALQT